MKAATKYKAGAIGYAVIFAVLLVLLFHNGGRALPRFETATPYATVTVTDTVTPEPTATGTPLTFAGE